MEMLLSILTIILLFNLVFIAGIYIGLNYNSQPNFGSQSAISKATKSKNTNSSNTISKISIDDTKYVTKINTDNLEKKYEDITSIKESQETIESSVNKLKTLKG
jgi:hypothetical protein